MVWLGNKKFVGSGNSEKESEDADTDNSIYISKAMTMPAMDIFL